MFWFSGKKEVEQPLIEQPVKKEFSYYRIIKDISEVTEFKHSNFKIVDTYNYETIEQVPLKNNFGQISYTPHKVLKTGAILEFMPNNDLQALREEFEIGETNLTEYGRMKMELEELKEKLRKEENKVASLEESTKYSGELIDKLKAKVGNAVFNNISSSVQH